MIRRRYLASLGGLTGALAVFAAVVAQSAFATTTQMYDGFSGSETLTQSDLNQMVGRQAVGKCTHWAGRPCHLGDGNRRRRNSRGPRA